jgi:hypothetical protein
MAEQDVGHSQIYRSPVQTNLRSASPGIFVVAVFSGFWGSLVLQTNLKRKSKKTQKMTLASITENVKNDRAIKNIKKGWGL